MIRLVLFDIDGTLIRTGGAGERAFARVAASEFKAPNGTAHLSFAGRTDISIVRDFFTHHRIEPSPVNFQRFFHRYAFWLDQLLEQAGGRVLPGVRESIEALRALPKPPLIGLLTGNIRLGAEIKLRHFGLWDFFEVGAFGDDHEERSQIAVIARDRGRRLLGERVRGDQILVVGDTPLDIACARAIKAKTLAVSTGLFRLDQLQEHRPTWAVENLEQVEMQAICA
jgi:phosphoglycolate phosphatase